MEIPCIKKGLKLLLIIDPLMPRELVIDMQRVRQVVLNLVQNAIKFTFKGGITVHLEYDLDTKYFKVSVTDSGIGISEEDQLKLFQMFGKLKSMANINTNGIGLGLFICKRICETFQGYIALEQSEVGQGTTFSF